ncbi:glycosyltransferase family 39 protein [Pseudanabaena sp. FACHB-1998]|uniref:glycosyltransferase family 39 protein n=1 Tax=Pseudanabaena sp. FACHB-1998 TaxID=2692858 RepID=UPI001681AEB2|nr:glycosyltransferase family 39 protein [Pseudanabaena sp. FACHB-1998]MBD2177463.1 glycosyltransferase family 39 protein [Pseudanabaena sp. FACHB-1998]
MQNFAVFIPFLAFLITITCFILLIYRLIYTFFLDDKSIKKDINQINKEQRDKEIVKRLNYLNSPITNFKFYQNISILIDFLPFLLINRASIFISNYVFYILENENKTSGLNILREIWGKWDTVNYLAIAQNWYQGQGDERFLIVFYPLYPVTISIFNKIINDYFLSGIIVSNIFLVLSLYYIYKLVLIEFQKKEIAFNTAKYMLLFPLSFFFSIVYTESLFIYLCIMTFYFARKKRWLSAGIMGFFAALTRSQGILLVIPLLIEILYEYRDLKYQIKSKSNHRKRRNLMSLRTIVSLLLIPCGTFTYLLINKLVSGNWLMFLTYQKEHWGQNLGFFTENLKNSFISIFTMNKVMAVNVWIPHIFLFFMGFGLLIYTVNKIRLSYTAFSFFYIIISYSPTWALSAPRYITGMFTLFIMLALLVNEYKYLEKYLDFILAILLCFYSIQFSLSRVF